MRNLECGVRNGKPEQRKAESTEQNKRKTNGSKIRSSEKTKKDQLETGNF